MQSTNLPSKYLVPFAKNDGAKVELPVTTATAGRASQSLGFPPITGQPPETGGLPPQLEDFNGAMNQPARIAWWSQLGGKFPFDNTFATDANIGGYPLGAELVSSDNTGTWLSLADNNVANPDTVGTGWAPARAYGAFALTGQTGGTVTPTPVQAMKRRITIAGALTSNLIVVLPNWLYSWDITNSTSGAFSVTAKTAAGAGVVIPQNGAPTPVSGDGTNITQPAQNIAAASNAVQPVQMQQVGTGQCRLGVTSATVLTLKPYGGNVVIVNGLPLLLPSAGVTASNAGLAASTNYYVYLGGNTLSPTLTLSTTGHVTNPSGVEVMSGDATRSLVGLVCTNTSSQFVDAPSQRLCANWFNRRNTYAAASASMGSMTSISNVEASTALRIQFVCWADESMRFAYTYSLSNSGNAAQNGTFVLIGIDGVAQAVSRSFTPSIFTDTGVSGTTEMVQFLTEGMHTMGCFWNTNGLGTSTGAANGQANLHI